MPGSKCNDLLGTSQTSSHLSRNPIHRDQNPSRQGQDPSLLSGVADSRYHRTGREESVSKLVSEAGRESGMIERKGRSGRGGFVVYSEGSKLKRTTERAFDLGPSSPASTG